jgi:hypothetical protein
VNYCKQSNKKRIATRSHPAEVSNYISHSHTHTHSILCVLFCFLVPLARYLRSTFNATQDIIGIFCQLLLVFIIADTDTDTDIVG